MREGLEEAKKILSIKMPKSGLKYKHSNKQGHILVCCGSVHTGTGTVYEVLHTLENVFLLPQVLLAIVFLDHVREKHKMFRYTNSHQIIDSTSSLFYTVKLNTSGRDKPLSDQLR